MLELFSSYREDMIETPFCDGQSSKLKKYKCKELHVWFLHSARCLKLVDICMKFCEKSLNGFQVIGRTQLRQDFVTKFEGKMNCRVKVFRVSNQV